MRCLSLFAFLLVVGFAYAAEPWQQPSDASPVFSPDERITVFSRGEGVDRHLYISERTSKDWTAAAPAPFSGHWMDLEPAMAPDGSYLVFVSNRPAHDGGAALDGYFNGKPRPGRGGNLWRVSRMAHGWGAPQRLPDVINDGTSVFSPAVAADGSVYFMKPDPVSGKFRLYLSRRKEGQYQAASPLSFSDGTAGDYDPAVAPDQSFVVFSSSRPPSTTSGSALFIAFATAQGWGPPQPLGILGIEARLSPDLATLYYSGSDQRIHRFALADWRAGVEGRGEQTGTATAPPEK
ncbi:TolB family protein [Dyella japonica]|uniref:Tol biopolymer transport system component n=1 Tax=Dyella japonica TaxID=231455 RepID=A0ABV2JQY9_9GAMM